MIHTTTNTKMTTYNKIYAWAVKDKYLRYPEGRWVYSDDGIYMHEEPLMMGKSMENPQHKNFAHLYKFLDGTKPEWITLVTTGSRQYPDRWGGVELEFIGEVVRL